MSRKKRRKPNSFEEKRLGIPNRDALVSHTQKELREYQQSIVNDVLSSDKDLVVCLPTGSGKTVIASAIISKLPNKVIFVVPRLELIKQAADEFGDVDIIWSDKTELTDRHCIIASKDSLRSQYKKLSDELKAALNEGVMIIDEAHYSLKQSHGLVDLIKPARVIGLTATPERMDGDALLKGSDSIHKYGIFDEVLQKETVPSLIKKGYLAPLRYYAKPIEGISEIRPDNPLAEELSDKQMLQIFDEHEIWGDLVRSYEEYGKGRPALGFTTTVAMGEVVAGIFQQAGYDFRVIHGEMTVKERQELIEMLRTRKIHGLVNASLLTYGFDCPPVSYAFNCRHVKSRPLWFQIVGRILRTCEGKEDAIFVDHADSISEFSEPDCSLPILDETIVWRADGETKEQKQARKKSMKKVQETMKLIQELDPIPAQLVEITPENTWERLVRIIQRLRSQNAILEQHVEHLQSSQTDLQSRVEEEQKKNLALIRENERIKENSTVKVIDKDKTFEYIKTHYARYRHTLERRYPEADLSAVHNAVIRMMEEDQDKLDFYFDKEQMIRSLDWWYDHYQRYIG